MNFTSTPNNLKKPPFFARFSLSRGTSWASVSFWFRFGLWLPPEEIRETSTRISNRRDDCGLSDSCGHELQGHPRISVHPVSLWIFWESGWFCPDLNSSLSLRLYKPELALRPRSRKNGKTTSNAMCSKTNRFKFTQFSSNSSPSQTARGKLKAVPFFYEASLPALPPRSLATRMGEL